jgi:hypothetical protein
MASSCGACETRGYEDSDWNIGVMFVNNGDDKVNEGIFNLQLSIDNWTAEDVGAAGVRGESKRGRARGRIENSPSGEGKTCIMTDVIRHLKSRQPEV